MFLTTFLHHSFLDLPFARAQRQVLQLEGSIGAGNWERHNPRLFRPFEVSEKHRLSHGGKITLLSARGSFGAV
jgi:hypothetical protein